MGGLICTLSPKKQSCPQKSSRAKIEDKSLYKIPCPGRRGEKLSNFLESLKKICPKRSNLAGLNLAASRSRGEEVVALPDVKFGLPAVHCPLPLTEAGLPGEHGAADDDAAQGQIWGKIFTS